MRIGRRWLVSGAALLLGVALGAGGGVYTDQAFPDWVPAIGLRTQGRLDTGTYQQALRVIQARYYDHKIDTAKANQSSIKGLIDSLGDPYSRYLTPDQFKAQQNDFAGLHSGVIGITVSLTGDYPRVTSVLPASPAQRAGLLPGDLIISVGGRDIKGMTADQSSALIRGPLGSTVTLGLQRQGEAISVSVQRSRFTSPSVVSQLLEGGVLYLRVYQFGDATAKEFDEQLRAGLGGATGVVIDLRDNGGGYISAATNVISQFVSSGEAYELRDGAGHVEATAVSGEHPAPAIPLFILVNANSASASEIVSGALQERGRGKLVGTPTFGKGSVQVDFQLGDGSDLHLTVQHWFLANGRTVIKNPLQPDVPVALAHPEDMYDVVQPARGHAADDQLNRALALIAAR